MKRRIQSTILWAGIWKGPGPQANHPPALTDDSDSSDNCKAIKGHPVNPTILSAASYEITSFHPCASFRGWRDCFSALIDLEHRVSDGSQRTEWTQNVSGHGWRWLPPQSKSKTLQIAHSAPQRPAAVQARWTWSSTLGYRPKPLTAYQRFRSEAEQAW